MSGRCDLPTSNKKLLDTRNHGRGSGSRAHWTEALDFALTCAAGPGSGRLQWGLKFTEYDQSC